MALSPSWVESANDPEGGFPLDNLPLGVFSDSGPSRCAARIGDHVLDLAALEDAGLLPSCGLADGALNRVMAAGPALWAELRARLTGLLAEGSRVQDAVAPMLRPLRDVQLHLPFAVAEYTDFYAGRQHAFNVGSMFRDPTHALPPNWLHIPIGYNGRGSTVVTSGTPVRRPCGQTKAPDADAPTFGPTRRLDFELELGAVVGTPSTMGARVSVDEADAMIFGYVLLNDWSARDVQAWEYQPLGPFQAKAFATSISPWVVTAEALRPFRVATPPRERPLLPYIADTAPMGLDVELEIALAPAGALGTVVSRTNARELYYSPAQQLAHHASSGCAMRTGDLLGSGTISGPDRGAFGSLLELTWGGRNPLVLPDGGTRTFLEDGDAVVLRGHAQGEGFRVGFGECAGQVLPALTDSRGH